ncbi:MAG TPA: hypothetical protein VG889_04100 [Rhizomicrobium sp.]|nr:hypothetical protein [Rhizomicrobium sp.]
MTSAARSCDGCTLCCKVLSVPALDKPGGTWCAHCDPARGCAIYEARPQECRDFFCGYILKPGMGEHWRPSVSRMVVITNLEARRHEFHVDPQRPDS